MDIRPPDPTDNRTTFVPEGLLTAAWLNRCSMTTGLRTSMKAVLPTLMAIVATLGGFALLKVSAAFESYLLLAVAFAFMIAGVFALFGRRNEPWWGA